MKKIIPLLVLAFVLLCSHQMFLVMDSYFLEEGKKAQIDLYNGSFRESENTIARNRMIDVSLVGHGTRTPMQENDWTTKDSVTVLNFTAGKSGTWVAGVSTRARNISLSAEKFNKYLEHDGIVDLLKQRQDSNQLNQDATERYSKHVKAIYQVGDKQTDDWKTELGYPIEFIPLENPYHKHTGDTLKVELLKDGAPLSNQLVYSGFKNSSHGHTHSDHDHEHSAADSENGHTHDESSAVRTDDNGIVSIPLAHDGLWFVRTIHMTEIAEEGLTHESKWATLTFELRHSHDSGHSHSHHHEGGIPEWVYWVGSLVVILGLYFFFRNRSLQNDV